MTHRAEQQLIVLNALDRGELLMAEAAWDSLPVRSGACAARIAGIALKPSSMGTAAAGRLAHL